MAASKKKKSPKTNKKSIIKAPTSVVSKKEKVSPNKTVAETVKKTVNKKSESNEAKEDSKSVTFEQMLESNFGKIGTPERTKADSLIKEAEIKLIEEVKQKFNPKKESSIINKNINTNGIAPIEEDSKETVSKENRVVDLHREFSFNKGTVLLFESVKINHDNTKIKRETATEYTAYGIMEHDAPFRIPIPCIDLQDAEIFWNELVDCEKNPEKYIKIEEVMETENKTIEPIKENNEVSKKVESKPQSIVPLGEEEKETIIKKYEGVPLNEVDIKELVKAAPSSPIQDQQKKGLGQVADISKIINNKIIKDMDDYGASIVGVIHSKSWCAMTQAEVNQLLNTQVSKEYTYELKNDGKGFFLQLTKNGITARAPKDENSYLKIS